MNRHDDELTNIGHNFGQPSASKPNYEKMSNENCPNQISLQEIYFERDLTTINNHHNLLLNIKRGFWVSKIILLVETSKPC